MWRVAQLLQVGDAGKLDHGGRATHEDLGGGGGGRCPDIISSLTKPTLYFHPGRERGRGEGREKGI